MSTEHNTESGGRRMSRGVLRRQTIVEDGGNSPKYKRQNTLTVYPASPTSNDEVEGLQMSRSGLSTPAKSPTRLSPNQMIISKSDDRISGTTKKAAARWRAASSFERSDSRTSTSVRVSGRRPRASAFRLGATSSVASSPRNESMSLSRDSGGGRSPHLSPSPRLKTRKEKSMSVNSSASSDRKNMPLQTSSEMSAESPSAIHRSSGPVAPLVAQKTTSDEGEATTAESPQKKFNNYQIKAVKKGLPDIIARDPQGKKYSIIHREITITPLCLCQKNNKAARKKPLSWIFSIFTSVVCVLFPLMSFSADVAFYVTCSDHYNHTAELLANVTASRMSKPVETFRFQEKSHANEAGHVLASPIKTFIISTVQATPTMFPPAPLMARGPIVPNGDEDTIVASLIGVNSTSNFTSEDIYTKKESITETKSTFSQSVIINTVNITVCAPPADIIEYMRTDEAADNLEHHRHVTIDIFEPVFILGSFPSLLLCILTRVVVMLTGHDHFISAYFINLACLPLQLATGALGVYSASYHLGEKGFSCWACAVNNDCSLMHAFSWLEEEVTTALIVSVITKLLDGVAGGIVIFVVIMRVLWRKTSHATIWWYALRYLATLLICISCLVVGALLVLTPALLLIKFNFLRLVTKFPGHQVVSSTILILLCFGVAVWSISTVLFLIYLTYNCYVYCRIKEHNADVL